MALQGGWQHMSRSLQTQVLCLAWNDCLLSSDNFSFSFKILSNEDPSTYLTGLFKH